MCSLLKNSFNLKQYFSRHYTIFFIYFQPPPLTQRQNSTTSDKDHKDDRLSTNNNIKISPIQTTTTTTTPNIIQNNGTPPASPQQPPQSRRLLQEILNRNDGPYPMIAIPSKGYWVDGTDHDEVQFDHRGVPVTPHGTWRAKFETDDTAKCYRRFFVGRVRITNCLFPIIQGVSLYVKIIQNIQKWHSDHFKCTNNLLILSNLRFYQC